MIKAILSGELGRKACGESLAQQYPDCLPTHESHRWASLEENFITCLRTYPVPAIRREFGRRFGLGINWDEFIGAPHRPDSVVHAERDRKLEAARKQRQLRRQQAARRSARACWA
jgi:hypothetical protein